MRRGCRRCARHRARRDDAPGMLDFDDVARRRAAPPSATQLADHRGRAAVRRRRSTSSSHRAPPARPKGATLTHHNILNNGYFVGAGACGSPTGDRLCIPVPLYHCFGMVMGNLGCVTHGATMVYPGARRSIRWRRCEAVAGGALHGALRRADDVHRRARPPRVRDASTCRACAPASWPARPARSR